MLPTVHHLDGHSQDRGCTIGNRHYEGGRLPKYDQAAIGSLTGTQVALRTGPSVWTPFPVTGWVPGAPSVLDLSWRDRVPINPIVNMRHPRHPRHPIVGLRRTRAESEGGSAQCSCDRRYARGALHTHCWSPFCLSPLPQLSRTLLARFKTVTTSSYSLFRYPSWQSCQTVL